MKVPLYPVEGVRRSKSSSFLGVCRRERRRDRSRSSPSLGNNRFIVRHIIRCSNVGAHDDEERSSLVFFVEPWKTAQLVLGEGDKALGVSNPVLNNG